MNLKNKKLAGYYRSLVRHSLTKTPTERQYDIGDAICIRWEVEGNAKANGIRVTMLELL